jgi:6-pyruvoyl-tetrahydropterin synthase
MLFKDGTREPLHGHNYCVKLKGNALALDNDMVFDFLDIKPIVRQICDSLDHKLLIPVNNPNIQIEHKEKNVAMTTKDGSFFSIPATDVLLLDIENTSVERLAVYLAHQIKNSVKQKFHYEFSELEIEVEETRGQSAVFILKKD